MSLYRETPCEQCGTMYPPGETEDGLHVFWNEDDGGPLACKGPGGSREEVTIDYEAAHAELDIWAYEAEGIRDSDTAIRTIVDAALKVTT